MFRIELEFLLTKYPIFCSIIVARKLVEKSNTLFPSGRKSTVKRLFGSLFLLLALFHFSDLLDFTFLL